MNVQPGTNIATRAASIVGQTHVYTDPAYVARLSRDYSWFSPLLEVPMREHVAQVAVAPGNTAELAAVLESCYELDVPVTVRGGGTGNYGQAVPLRGGLLLLTNRLDRIIEVSDATVTLQAGCRLGDVVRVLEDRNLDLRLLPSTYLTSSVGGFIAGGTGGIGSITWGTLRDGNISSVLIHSVDSPSTPKLMRGEDLDLIIHTYGTVGVISEVTLPVEPRQPWSEAVYSFPTLTAASDFALDVIATGLPLRLLSVHEWPIPSYFGQLEQVGAIHHDRVAVLLEAVESSGEAIITASRARGGMLTWSAPPRAYHHSPIAISSFAFNHTTLVGKLADPALTYLQVGFSPETVVEGIRYVRERYRHDIAFHIEYMRRGDRLIAAALPLFPFQGEDALAELMRIFADAGARVINPHTHVLDVALADPRLLGYKASLDPHGLLNPGKLSASPHPDPSEVEIS